MPLVISIYSLFYLASKTIPFQLLHYGLMPRVVQDQSHKFETDELFRKLAEDTEVLICVLSVNYVLCFEDFRKL